jgi:hypothetical protein
VQEQQRQGSITRKTFRIGKTVTKKANHLIQEHMDYYSRRSVFKQPGNFKVRRDLRMVEELEGPEG